MEWLAGFFLFILLREWLLPLTELTDTSELTPFLLLVAGVLLVDLLLEWRWLGLLLKLGGGFYLLHHTFFATPLFDTEWLKDVYSRLTTDIPLLYSQNWLGMAPVSRSLLFYLLIVLLVSLLSYLILQQRQGLWFVFMTEAYLATLDTFMPYDADGGIIRSLIAGFLMLAVLHFLAMERLAGSTGRNKFAYWKSLLAPVLIISLSVGIAYSAPKKEASWPDPISYFMGNGSEGGNSLKKVGYDNNDSQLGGPFVQDESLVFTATTNEKYYWRGDSKDIYTGQGWQKGDVNYQAILEPRNFSWDDKLFSNIETKTVDAMVQYKNSEKHAIIFYEGQLTRLPKYAPQNATIQYDVTNKHVQTHEGIVTIAESTNAGKSKNQKLIDVPNPVLLKMFSYEATSEVPIISEKHFLNLQSDFPFSIEQQYLQLPDSLPPRVKELAEKVTASAKTPYEKVRAVEQYLRSSGEYKYEIKDVPVPKEGQDFVDQFLFDSKRGYCDHFSTSMAVMLRSIGIPTRWVKGFAPGTETDTTETGKRIIEVRNKDAHSWVEVYFADTGWIPFEATTSFVSPVRVEYDVNQAQEEQPVINNLPVDREQPNADDRLERLEEDENTGNITKRISSSYFLISFVILLGVAVVLWRKRERLMIWWVRKQIATYPEDRFIDKYSKLLFLYEKILMNRQEGETLREYVKRLSVSGDVRQDLWYLTNLYEQIHYGFKEVEGKARNIANTILDRLSQQMKP
ncbi:DUF4129 domain-containing transglutaminase family protein [Brevibacillus sp. SYSU BS000544]|uniref:DUF4129 domain-containing transglutaminase family protein n=1 Tax=Brevibacillus sp. SYSU BS000544 TaxID=3416443 RepID=UPI003CE5AF25